MIAPLNLRVLRTLDKADRDAPLVIFEKLTTGHKDGSGAFIDGCGLTNGQAIALIAFLGKDRKIADRIDLMCRLEDAVIDDRTGETALDRLLTMPVSNDESWNDGKRPKNIGWALDDLMVAVRISRGGGDE